MAKSEFVSEIWNFLSSSRHANSSQERGGGQILLSYFLDFLSVVAVDRKSKNYKIYALAEISQALSARILPRKPKRLGQLN